MSQNLTLPSGGLVEAPFRYPKTRERWGSTTALESHTGPQQRRSRTDSGSGARAHLTLDVRFVQIFSPDTTKNWIVRRPVRQRTPWSSEGEGPQ